MTPTLLDLALKAGFSDPIEGWMGEAYEERLEAFAKLVIEHEAEKRKPLTDEQILAVARDHYNPHQRAEISFARAIETAHGIKGEA
jgi:hypothetical protein